MKIEKMPSLLVLLSAVAASVYHVEAMTDVNVTCLPEEPGKKRKCSGFTEKTTPSPVSSGWSWQWNMVDSRFEEDGLEEGESDYSIVQNFRTGETVRVNLTDDGACTITVNDTKTCHGCQSEQAGCFDGENSQIKFDCTNLENGIRSPVGECVSLHDPFFYPFGLIDASSPEDVAEYVVDPSANVELHETTLPDCYEEEPMLIKSDSSTVPMCEYDPSIIEVTSRNKQQVTIKVNDIWTPDGPIPSLTQVFVHTNGVDSVLRHNESDNFQCLNDEGDELIVNMNTGSEELDIQCYQASPTDPFLAAIDLVITDDIICGSNEVGHPCSSEYEPIFESCSWRLIIPCDSEEICSSPPAIETLGGDKEDEPIELKLEDTGGLCKGKTMAATEIDLFNSTVTESTLHEPGGRLVYQNVGKVRNNPVNLVVTIYDGEYTTTVPEKNGKGSDGEGNPGEGMFGNINMQTLQKDFLSGEGNFEFCFRDPETDEKVTVDSFMWSVFDLDERNAKPDGIKEKFIMDTSQAQDYVLWPNTEESEVKLFCESFTLWPEKSKDADPYQLPCPAGDRTVFHSSTKGKGTDNPKDKDDMTDQQKKRSIQFTFVNTACWRFTYNHYCPSDEVGYDHECLWYGGGNFLFAGSAKQLIEEGECITDSPTSSPSNSPTVKPTKNPTLSPTATPTKNPTMEPTKNPTLSPTAAPTKTPTASPTVTPTKTPTASPTKAPTKTPTSSPSAAPSGSFYPSSTPTNYPTKSMHPSSSPTDVPTKAPTPVPTKNPTASPTKSPTAEPTKNPTASPTKSPTVEPTKSPTASPTTNPTIATDSPTRPINEGNTEPPIVINGGDDDDDDMIFRPNCPDDVVLLHHEGETEIDLDRVVKVVSQDKSTVTVALTQGWDPVVEDLYVNNNDYYYYSEEEPIDHIFYSYRVDHFNEVCYEEAQVKQDDTFATIEIACSVTKPYALLELCVVDDLEHGFLTSKDDATVPKCCEPSFQPETPTVCYTIEIKCVSECLDDVAPALRRGLLRGGAFN